MSLSTTFYTVFSKKSDQSLFGHFFSSLHTHTCTHACVHTHMHACMCTHTHTPLQKILTAFLGKRLPFFKVCTDEKIFLVFLCSFHIVYIGFWPENIERSHCVLRPLIRYSPVSFYQHSKYLLLFSSLRFLLLWLFGMD